MPTLSPEIGTLLALDKVMLTKFDPVVDMTTKQMGAFTAFTKSKPVDLDGYKEKRYTLRTGVAAGGVGVRAEATELPWATSEEYDYATAKVLYQYASLELTGQQLDMSKGAGTLINFLADLVDGNLKALQRATSFMVMGDGTGVRGEIVSVQGSNVLLMDTCRNVEVNMRLDFWASNTIRSNGGTGYVIKAVDKQNKQITVDDDTDLVAGDVAIQYGNAALSGGVRTSLEFEGWSSIVAPTGTYLGLDKAAKEYWRPLVFANGGTPRDLTMILMQRFFDSYTENYDEPPTNIWVNPQMARYIAWMLRDAAVPTEAIPNEFGIDNMTFVYGNNRYRINVDPGFEDGTINAMNYDSFERIIASPGKWIPGVIGSRWNQVPRYDAYVAYWKQYWGFVCKKPSANGQIRDLNNADSKTN